MGSKSDWPSMQKAAEMLSELGIPHEAKVFSAHRTPGPLEEYLASAVNGGVKVFIAGAGGAAHLAGVIASKTVLPVLGVPMQSKALQGLDSLLSTVQMPEGIPVATLAIGDAGAANAGLFAAQILGVTDETIRAKLLAQREQQAAKILAEKL
jgi:5-(carboxyamino)imidazole ribonucleotide mutase